MIVWWKLSVVQEPWRQSSSSASRLYTPRKSEAIVAVFAACQLAKAIWWLSEDDSLTSRLSLGSRT